MKMIKWDLKARWKALGIDKRTILRMLKGGLPPTIVIAMYQADRVAGVAQSYGFLSAIISVIAQCLLPRARFTKSIIYSLVAMCISASISCLGVYCAVRAREHTAAPGDSPTAYNSSACAVSAIWFLFAIWLVNTIRAYRPIEFQTPASAFAIFLVITMTRSAVIGSLSSGLEGIRRLLIAFLIGFAVSAGVSIFILPTTSRSTFFHTIENYPTSVKEILAAQIAFVKCSEEEGPWQITRRATVARRRSDLFRSQTFDESDQEKKEKKLSESEAKAAQLKSAIQKLSSTQSTARAELYFAKQEIAWGRLTEEDLDSLFALLRSVLLPLAGIAMLPDVFHKLTKTVEAAEVTEATGVVEALERPTDEDRHQPVVGARSSILPGTIGYELPEITEHFVRPLCDRLEAAADLAEAGFLHAFTTLRLTKLPKGRGSANAHDEETPEDKAMPGSPHFAAEFERKVYHYFALRKHLPEKWASLTAFTPFFRRGSMAQEPRTIQKEFFVLLFISHLQDVLLQAVLELVFFADSKVADGTMTSKRFLFPKREHIKQWFFSSGPEEKENDDEKEASTDNQKQATGDLSFKSRDPLKSRYADPEHMSPTNNWQRVGRGIRSISHFLSSEQSSFGVRVALAAFCPAILAYLHQTQTFFFHNRVIWVVIVVLIGMAPTSGNSLFGLMGRFMATILATILAFIVWYMVAGRTAGVIVMAYFANCIMYYPYIKNPRFIPASIIGVITLNLIVGFELMARELGVDKIETSGLPYYPIYLFGPYRCIAVLTACAIAFFWVVFPSPTSAGSRVRKTLGRSLFVLATFYSCMHTSIEVWINQEQGDLNDNQSPGRLLDRARTKLLAEEMALLKNLRLFSDFTRYEPPIGGRFPKETYDRIISAIQTILTSMDLMAHATRNLERMAASGSISSEPSTDSASHISGSRSPASSEHSVDGERWVRNLAQAANSPEFRSGVITSVLYHLSAAVTNSLCLPPYLAPPHPFPLARTLRGMNEDLLRFKNVENPSFAAIIAIEVLSSMVSSNLKILMSDIKRLVGELNFDVYVREYRRQMQEKSHTK